MSIALRRIIGVLTLGGAFSGLLIVFPQFLASSPDVVSLMLSGVFAAMYFWGLVSGVWLLEGSKRGTTASLPFWCAQIPQFSLPFFLYEFTSGARVAVYVSADDFGFDAFLGSQFNLFWGSEFEWYFSVNFFALAMFIILLRSSRRARGS